MASVERLFAAVGDYSLDGFRERERAAMDWVRAAAQKVPALDGFPPLDALPALGQALTDHDTFVRNRARELRLRSADEEGNVLLDGHAEMAEEERQSVYGVRAAAEYISRSLSAFRAGREQPQPPTPPEGQTL